MFKYCLYIHAYFSTRLAIPLIMSRRHNVTQDDCENLYCSILILKSQTGPFMAGRLLHLLFAECSEKAHTCKQPSLCPPRRLHHSDTAHWSRDQRALWWWQVVLKGLGKAEAGSLSDETHLKRDSRWESEWFDPSGAASVKHEMKRQWLDYMIDCSVFLSISHKWVYE